MRCGQVEGFEGCVAYKMEALLPRACHCHWLSGGENTWYWCRALSKRVLSSKGDKPKLCVDLGKIGFLLVQKVLSKRGCQGKRNVLSLVQRVMLWEVLETALYFNPLG